MVVMRFYNEDLQPNPNMSLPMHEMQKWFPEINAALQ